MMLVQATDDEGEAVNAFAAVAEESNSESATDSDSVNVEQQGIADGIKRLVQQYKAVFPDPYKSSPAHQP